MCGSYSTPPNLVPGRRGARRLCSFFWTLWFQEGNGLDVCRRLRSNPALSTIPIIFLTARAGENDRVLGLELGADDYITKPFATRELIARVKAVLRRFERPTAPSIISFEGSGDRCQRHAIEGAGRTHHHDPRPNFGCSTTWPGIRAAFSAATTCWTPSGGMPVL